MCLHLLQGLGEPGLVMRTPVPKGIKEGSGVIWGTAVAAIFTAMSPTSFLRHPTSDPLCRLLPGCPSSGRCSALHWSSLNLTLLVKAVFLISLIHSWFRASFFTLWRCRHSDLSPASQCRRGCCLHPCCDSSFPLQGKASPSLSPGLQQLVVFPLSFLLPNMYILPPCILPAVRRRLQSLLPEP